jgi:hypothetical protein
MVQPSSRPARWQFPVSGFAEDCFGCGRDEGPSTSAARRVPAACPPRDAAGVRAVPRPGGLFVHFGGYRERALQTISVEEALAVTVVEKSMAVDAFQHVETLVAQAAAAGLRLVSNEWLAAAVMPNFRRLDRMASLLLLVPPLRRRWLAGRSSERGRNLAAAALGRWTVSMGLQGYREVVWCNGDAGG